MSAVARSAAVALLALVSLGCRSTPDDRPVRIDVGSGSPDAVARRGAIELADAPVLAARAPRAGPGDRRYVVRLERDDSGGDRTFRALFESELLGTGRFLLLSDGAIPLVVVRTTGSPRSQDARIQVRSPDGEPWVEVFGRIEP